jgi:pyruvate/2-oxoglutarate dehydrogenase complex dihydrolipoamide dehydrogenase (E3) component
MTNFDYDLGVIGGGAAGLTAAAGAAQFGAKTILIEKSDKLGGDCLHLGCVPSKALIRTAGVWTLARRLKEFGLPDLELAPVDLNKVMERVHAVVDKIQEQDSPERLCGLGAEVLFGHPQFFDDHSVKVNERNISAKAWIIATGSRPSIPPVDGIADVPYWTNETVFSQKKLPDSLIILGGGPIGLEMAQAFQRLGSQVTIIEFMDQILGPEDPDIAKMLMGRLEAEGIKILTDTKAVQVEKKGKKISLKLVPATGKGKAKNLEADALFTATGRRPNVEGLGLESAGVEFTTKGIRTDLRMRTNVSHIYACGDVNGQFLFTHVAGYEGGVALTNICLHLPRRADYSKVPWCTYTDPEVASIGLNEKRAKKEGVAYSVLEDSFEENDRALIEAEPFGKIKILVTPKGKLLGCQIIGAHAGELIHEWIPAFHGGLRLSTLAGAIHVYPTRSEISKKVAGNYFARKIFSDRTKKVLRFFFHFKGRGCTIPEEK